jgi:DNA-binding response OmpR family regulator
MIRESNLLLVEDDMAVRQSLTRVLATENYKVFGASSCREALLLCTQNQIDVVLLDLNLDPEDGWEVFHQLRELRPDLPIFVTSGQPQRFAHSSADRADGILEKPFDLPVLVGLLNHATRPGPLLRIPIQRATSRSILPTARKKPRFEMAVHPAPSDAPLAEANALKLLIPPYWLFVYPWRVLLYTYRALFHR